MKEIEVEIFIRDEEGNVIWKRGIDVSAKVNQKVEVWVDDILKHTETIEEEDII